MSTKLADLAAEDSEGNGALALAARAGNTAAISMLWDANSAKSDVGTKARRNIHDETYMIC
jgi:ankyrin repeat protein